MAWTSADVTALKTAIASGELSVQFADRRVQYRSIDELQRALKLVEAEVNSATVSASTRCTFASFTKD